MDTDNQTDEEITEQVSLYYELFHAEQDIQDLDNAVNPLELHDDEYEAWIEKVAHEMVENGPVVVSEWWEGEMQALEATLTDEDKAAYARYLKSSIDPREIEDEKFYTFEIKGKETKELIAVVIYNCTSEQKAYGRAEKDAAGDAYELVEVQPAI
jgi:hypothetical protein